MFPQAPLRDRVRSVTAQTLATGALQPIPTEFHVLADAGVRFLVRIVSRLARKPHALTSGRKPGCNPFLPYQPELFVADVSATHVALLNKFPVVDEHLLIVTRYFEHQQTCLNSDDFLALARCLPEYPALGFYNSGKIAGASQPHKHLQLIPLPLSDSSPDLPLAPFHDASPGNGVCGPSVRLPFAHAAVRLDPQIWRNPQQASDELHDVYRRLLDTLRIQPPRDRETRIRVAYNLLVTQDWMLAVPRCRECFAGISLNAMAFAGALLVRDTEQLAKLQQAGPMTALQYTAGTAQG